MKLISCAFTKKSDQRDWRLFLSRKLPVGSTSPVIIINLGIFQAVYTAGVKIPKPISTCRYYHRPLNIIKLIEVGFSYLPPLMTLDSVVNKYRLPPVIYINKVTKLSLKCLEIQDIPQVCDLLEQYLQQFEFKPKFNEKELAHLLLPIENVIYSYVVKVLFFNKDTNGLVTDFVSFYSLPSLVVNYDTPCHVNAAYLLYYAPKGLGSDKSRTRILLNDALILAKEVFVYDTGGF